VPEDTKVRSLVTTCVLLIAVFCFGRAAKADLWLFTAEAFEGTSEPWYSDTAIGVGFAEYEYSWELTDVEVRLEGGALVEPQWFSYLSSVEEEDRSGSGSSEELAFAVYGVEGLEMPFISATFNLGVDAGGTGAAQLYNVNFVTTGGDPVDVTGARVTGWFEVTGVPEPGTLLMFSLGGLVLLRRRRA